MTDQDLDRCTCGASRAEHQADGPCRRTGCPRWFPQPQPESDPVLPAAPCSNICTCWYSCGSCSASGDWHHPEARIVG